MFAVVKIAGQQFKVQEGQNLYVPHLQGKVGDKVEFSEVLLVDNDGKFSVGSDPACVFFILEEAHPTTVMINKKYGKTSFLMSAFFAF